MNNGTFDYQIRSASTALSVAMLVATCLCTYLVRITLGNPIITAVCFFALLIAFASICVWITDHFVIRQGTFEMNDDRLIVTMGKKTISVTRDEVNGVGCDPVMSRHFINRKNNQDVRFWQISILTVDKKYYICSVNALANDKEGNLELKDFMDFGKALKKWYGMLDD